MTVGPVISILGGVPAGRLVDGLEAPVLRLGLSLLILGTLLLAVLPGLPEWQAISQPFPC